MPFKEMMSQVIEWLRHDKRISYRALKQQFDVNDDDIEHLTEALLYAYPQVVDADNRGLVCTEPPVIPYAAIATENEIALRLDAVLAAVTTLLQHEGRLTYRALKTIFALDDTFLQTIRGELSFRRLARDEEGEGLVWTGEAMTPPERTAAAHRQLPYSPGEKRLMAPVDESALVEPGPIHHVPEAERRQLTVIFCGLAGFCCICSRLHWRTRPKRGGEPIEEWFPRRALPVSCAPSLPSAACWPLSNGYRGYYR